jgi:hypothetical protein
VLGEIDVESSSRSAAGRFGVKQTLTYYRWLDSIDTKMEIKPVVPILSEHNCRSALIFKRILQ